MGKMRALRRAIRSCVGQAVSFDMKSGNGAVMAALFERVGRGQRVPDDEVRGMISDTTMAGHEDDEDDRAGWVTMFSGPTIIQGPAGGKSVAYVPVKGVALWDFEYQPYAFSSQLLARNMKTLANDPTVGTIVMDFATPGGLVTGTAEAAQAIADAAKRKTVIALINPLAASAGYWLASQCNQIISTISGEVGSIGVFMVHTDCSKFNEMQGFKVTYIFAGEHKVDGNSDEPLSEDAREYFQKEVDVIYDKFTKAVAKGRGVTQEEVIAKFGKGRCMMADMAKRFGLIDEIAPIDTVLGRCGVSMEIVGRRGESQDADIVTIASAVSADEPVDVICFFTVTDDDDARTKHVYADGEWPKRMQIHRDVDWNADLVTFTDDTVKLTVENGMAVYRKESAAKDGTGALIWTCALVESTYEPKPAAVEPPAPPAADPPAPPVPEAPEQQAVVEEAVTVEALAEASPDTAAAAQSARNRLAILSLQ